jgi:DNA-directed RNA polymerase sigma subunit (sigma70/sigma32)
MRQVGSYQAELRRVKRKRLRMIAAMRDEGQTFQQIADRFGVTRQRAHQLWYESQVVDELDSGA